MKTISNRPPKSFYWSLFLLAILIFWGDRDFALFSSSIPSPSWKDIHSCEDMERYQEIPRDVPKFRLKKGETVFQRLHPTEKGTRFVPDYRVRFNYYNLPGNDFYVFPDGFPAVDAIKVESGHFVDLGTITGFKLAGEGCVLLHMPE